MSIARSVASSVASSVAGAVTASSGGIAYAQLASTATLHFTLDDNAASTAVVEANNGTNGTLVGANTADLSEVAAVGRGLRFDSAVPHYVGSIGTGATVQFIHQTGVFTLVGWIAKQAIDIRYFFLGNTLGAAGDNGFFLACEHGIGLGNNSLRIGVHKSDGTWLVDAYSSDNALPDTDTHHFAVVCDIGTVVFYVDGVALTTNYQTAFTSVGTGGATRILRVGATNTTGGAVTLPLDGLLDDVLIFDTALSKAEVAALYLKGSA